MDELLAILREYKMSFDESYDSISWFVRVSDTSISVVSRTPVFNSLEFSIILMIIKDHVGMNKWYVACEGSHPRITVLR